MNIKSIVYFVAGAVTGSLATYFYLNKKYEEKVVSEVEELREYYNKREEIEIKIDEIFTYENVASVKNEGKGEPIKYDNPEVITPDDYSELETYENATLTYYSSDDILTDMSNNIIANRLELVGDDFMNHFGEHEVDAVYLRNDRLKVDIEILRDGRHLEDVKKLYSEIRNGYDTLEDEDEAEDYE